MGNIILIGFMGTGKTTISKRLSSRYNMEIVDTDRVIARREGLSISEIFEKYGEEYFRTLETNLLIELQSKQNTIISCGGGTPLREQNAAIMKQCGRVVLLDASAAMILERVKDGDSRPLLRGRKNLEGISELLEQRMPKYKAAADIVIWTDHKTIDAICEEIMKKIQGE